MIEKSGNQEKEERFLNCLCDGFFNSVLFHSPKGSGKKTFLFNKAKKFVEQKDWYVFSFNFEEWKDDIDFILLLIDFLNKITNNENSFFNLLKNSSKKDFYEIVKRNKLLFDVVSIINEIAEVTNKPILMLLTEIYELEKKENIGFIKSLRTGLDVNQGRIKIIFTASDEDKLKSMFHDYEKPFYLFCSEMDFNRFNK